MYFSSVVTTPELCRARGSHGSYMRDNVTRGFIENEIPENVKERILSHSSKSIAEVEIVLGLPHD
jgi:hypothetical protein